MEKTCKISCPKTTRQSALCRWGKRAVILKQESFSASYPESFLLFLYSSTLSGTLSTFVYHLFILLSLQFVPPESSGIDKNSQCKTEDARNPSISHSVTKIKGEEVAEAANNEANAPGQQHGLRSEAAASTTAVSVSLSSESAQSPDLPQNPPNEMNITVTPITNQGK